MAYTFNVEPEPALLDVAAIAPDRILVLDAYFSVVIFHGHTIAQWRNKGYHQQAEYAVRGGGRDGTGLEVRWQLEG